MTSKTFIISECGINHMGNMNLAKQMIEASKECGVDAVKFQTYKTDLRAKPSAPAYEILKHCEFSYEQQTELKLYADKVGIEFFSTPFDDEALLFLIDKLGIRRIKLASFDVTNRKFLSTVNAYAKNLPALKVIMSTGMAGYRDINSALKQMQNVKHLTLMHCISAYPTPESKTNLSAIQTLKQIIGDSKYIGYSDHTNDILAPALSVIAGATTVEKHFTLDLNNGAVDNPVSADPQAMKQMVEVIRLHESMIGNGLLEMQDIEKPTSVYRRYS